MACVNFDTDEREARVSTRHTCIRRCSVSFKWVGSVAVFTDTKFWQLGCGSLMDTDVGLVTERSRIRLAAVLLSHNESGQVVHTHMTLLPFGVIWYIDALWESNGRLVVCGLTSHHTHYRSYCGRVLAAYGFITISHLQADCLETGMDQLRITMLVFIVGLPKIY